MASFCVYAMSCTWTGSQNGNFKFNHNYQVMASTPKDLIGSKFRVLLKF